MNSYQFSIFLLRIYADTGLIQLHICLIHIKIFSLKMNLTELTVESDPCHQICSPLISKFKSYFFDNSVKLLTEQNEKIVELNHDISNQSVKFDNLHDVVSNLSNTTLLGSRSVSTLCQQNMNLLRTNLSPMLKVIINFCIYIKIKYNFLDFLDFVKVNILN